jgi:hypothetical protein
MREICGRQLTGLAVLAVAFSLAACDSGSRTATATPSLSAPTAAATASQRAPTAPAAEPSATFEAMQTAEGGEFLSPSGNISCEVNYQRDGLTGAYCQMAMPARSVTMGVTGQYTICTGQQCLGNAGEGTPILAYGTATGVGPFRCESATTGVTCVADGRGFQISASGITSVSS